MPINSCMLGNFVFFFGGLIFFKFFFFFFKKDLEESYQSVKSKDSMCSDNLVVKSTVKPVLCGHSKRRPNWFSGPLPLNAGQKYCRMLQGEHLAKLLTVIKLTLVIKVFVLCIF